MSTEKPVKRDAEGFPVQFTLDADSAMAVADEVARLRELKQAKPIGEYLDSALKKIERKRGRA